MARAVRAWARAAVLAFVLAPACALPASAQTGSGLYEPFPEPATRAQAQDYLRQLLFRTVSARELEDGRFLGGLSGGNAAGRPASRRAATTTTWLDAPTTLILLLAAGAGAAALARRKATPGPSRAP